MYNLIIYVHGDKKGEYIPILEKSYPRIGLAMTHGMAYHKNPPVLNYAGFSIKHDGATICRVKLPEKKR